MSNTDHLIIDALSCNTSHNPQELILNNISFTVPEGQLVAILGHNGSGKTTLFKCINQLYDYSGNITLNNEPVDELNREQLSQNIIALSQTLNQNFFISLSIYDNFKLWLMREKSHSSETKDTIKRYLATFSKKFATNLDLPVEILSGGEKQLLALAFILKSPPKLLLLDEHTSALDRKKTTEIMDFTRNKIKQYNLTCLMIVHDIHLALKYADRVITLKHGKIMSDQLNASVQAKQQETASVF